MYNLIPCNLYLNRIRRSDTDKCDLCNELDDLGHYFYECQPVHTFWHRFGQWWQGMTGEIITIDKKMCIFGTVDKLIKNKLLNACIIIAKWHIFKMKLDQAEIFFYKFLCDLKYYILTEKTIALRNNKVVTYQRTWNLLEEHLT